MRTLRVIWAFLLLAVPCAASEPPNRLVVDDAYRAITTFRDMNSLTICLEAYRADHGRYPSDTTMQALKNLLEPIYIAHLETKDAWGTEFRYLPSQDGSTYRLISAGSDRAFDERSWTLEGVLTDSKQDAVFAGHFVRKWAVDFP